MSDSSQLDTAELLRELKARRSELPAPAGVPLAKPLDEITVQDIAKMDPAAVEETTVEAAARMEGTLIRTYRHLRLVLVAAAPAILLAIVVAWNSGFDGLPSISHYYYTPARIVFVGALVAASATLLALSGRGTQRGWLDLAALFAPLIALVPTKVGIDDFEGYDPGCQEGMECIPEDAKIYIATGMFIWFVFAALVLFYAIASGIAAELGRDTLTPQEPQSRLARWLPISVGGIIVGIYAWFWVWANEMFLDGAHFISASLFFVIITIVALHRARQTGIDTVGTAARPSWRTQPLQRIWWERHWLPKIFATFHGWIAFFMALDIIAAVLVLKLKLRDPISIGGLSIGTVFFVEAVALILFTLFWIVETRRKWDEADPE